MGDSIGSATSACVSPLASRWSASRRWWGGQLRPAAKTDSTSLNTASTLTCTGTDQFALELSQAAKDGEHQPAGIRPCVLERTKASPRVDLANLAA
jgi:hypothetical protein